MGQFLRTTAGVHKQLDALNTFQAEGGVEVEGCQLAAPLLRPAQRDHGALEAQVAVLEVQLPEETATFI